MRKTMTTAVQVGPKVPDCFNGNLICYLLIGKMFSLAAATLWRLAKGLCPNVLLLAVLSFAKTLSPTFVGMPFHDVASILYTRFAVSVVCEAGASL